MCGARERVGWACALKYGGEKGRGEGCRLEARRIGTWRGRVKKGKERG